MIKGFILLAIAVIFNGVANILMKKGMMNAAPDGGAVEMVKHYLSSWPVILGLFLFAVNVVAYTQALSKIPLSIAYPVMVALTGLIVIAGSMYFFKESISSSQWGGFLFIIIGIVLVAK
jgi:small multidrug resistance pump